MNGRLYDPVLGRMLSPDNYVADGGFTQDYNRYTYARNNPLIYTDPDGNNPLFILGLMVKGAILSGVGYSLGTLEKGDNNKFSLGGLGKSMAIGAVSGVLTYGIGEVASKYIGGGVNGAIFQTATHGVLQGAVAKVQGGTFSSGFSAGVFGSIAASGDGSAGAAIFVAGMSAKANGGNFWVGAAQGANVALFNHMEHRIGPGDKKRSTNQGKGNNLFHDHYTGKDNPVGYSLAPRNTRDALSMEHDQFYDLFEAKGLSGVFQNADVAPADMYFTIGQMKLSKALIQTAWSFPASSTTFKYYFGESMKSLAAGSFMGFFTTPKIGISPSPYHPFFK